LTILGKRANPFQMSADDIVQQVIAGKEKLFTPQEVGDRLGVSLYVLKQWRLKGEGPQFTTLGTRTVRYPETALAAFVADGMSVSEVPVDEDDDPEDDDPEDDDPEDDDPEDDDPEDDDPDVYSDDDTYEDEEG
jgi:hypothetical protein